MIEFQQVEVLTFDCYGTLIDWERGLLDAFRPALAARNLHRDPDELLEGYARHEAALESGEYRPYREVVATAFRQLCTELGFEATHAEAATFADSVGDWPPFPDSSEALARLATRFKLGVITNCDDDLFARSNALLGVTFNWVVTAAQARSYKPSHANFELACATIGLPRNRILHVAQSLYHDHVPARQLGLRTVWVNRRHNRPGSGATPPAEATPDLTVPDLKTLADLALG